MKEVPYHNSDPGTQTTCMHYLVQGALLIAAHHIFVRVTACLVSVSLYRRRPKCDTCVYYTCAAAVSLERQSAFARQHGEHMHAVQFLCTGMRLGVHMQCVLPADNAVVFFFGKNKSVPLRVNTLISCAHSYKSADAQETRNECCLAQ